MLALYIISLLKQDSILYEIIITCNNKRAYRCAFSKSPLGIRDAVQANYDIVLVIRHLQKLISIPLSASHAIRGNDGVDHSTPLAPPLVRSQIQSDHVSMLHAPESHIISVQYKGDIFVSNLLQPVKHELHYQPLKDKLQRDNKWTEHQFDSVDWLAYKRAICKLHRSHRVSITKLSHQLWNTNKQNNRYYNHSDLCPYCKAAEETLPHVFTCKHPLATQGREEALKTAFSSLQSAGTPSILLTGIQSGLYQ
jgi:glutaredoxin